MLCVSQRQWENVIKFKWLKYDRPTLRPHAPAIVTCDFGESHVTDEPVYFGMSQFTGCASASRVLCGFCLLNQSLCEPQKSSALHKQTFRNLPLGSGTPVRELEKFSSVRTDRCACSFLQRAIH
uniref:Uncharacterized protein n=1 Tax=Anguilla anguilla TaxID=7936 RepID=A0A0E9X3S8_ANGAN